MALMQRVSRTTRGHLCRLAAIASLIAVTGGCDRPPFPPPYAPGVTIDAVEVNGAVVERDLADGASITAREGDSIVIRFSLTPALLSRAVESTDAADARVSVTPAGYAGHEQRWAPSGHPRRSRDWHSVTGSTSHPRVVPGKAGTWAARYTFGFPAPYREVTRSEWVADEESANKKKRKDDEKGRWESVTTWEPVDWMSDFVLVRVRLGPTGYEANSCFRVFWGSRPLPEQYW